MKASWVLTDDQRRMIVDLYREGASPSKLAERFGVTDTAIVQLARRAGVAPQRPDLAHLAGTTHGRGRKAQQRKFEGAEMQAAAVPNDTRSLTAAFFGDPLPGRSALDQRGNRP